MIAISNQATSRARVNALRKRLAYFRPADTSLRRSPRINLHKHTSSLCRFVRELKQKVRPSGIPNRLRQHTTRESFNVQVFDCNQAVVVNDLARFFVMKVTALITNVVVKSLQQQRGMAAAVRSSLTTRYASLQSPELFSSQVIRLMDEGWIYSSNTAYFLTDEGKKSYLKSTDELGDGRLLAPKPRQYQEEM